MNAAGGDIWRGLRSLVLRRLGRFRDRTILERDLDTSRKRLLENPDECESEVLKWRRILTAISASGADASYAVRNLQREITFYGMTQNINQSGLRADNVSNNTVSGVQNNTYNFHGPASDVGPESLDDDKDGYERESTDTGGGPSMLGPLIFIIVIIIIGVSILNSGGSGSGKADPFPNRSDQWPKGATAASVLAPVNQRLSACAQEPVLSPVNCPQSLSDDDNSPVSDVHWTLHGNPTDGARIVYIDKQFQVAGNVIMIAAYQDSSGNEFSLRYIHYRAWVNWNSGNPGLIEITNFAGSTPPKVSKRNPGVSWSNLQSAVLLAFRKCASSRTIPLPAQCPTTADSPILGDNARWELSNDPVLNAQQNFNSSWGYIEVTGTFSLRVTYSIPLLGSHHLGGEAGNYHAIVTLDGTRLDVLEITA